MKQKLLSCFRIRTILIISLLSTLFVGNAWAQDTKTDVMFAKGFGSYTTNSFSAAGTDRSGVANSTNATGVTYAMQVFNGSTGAVRGNQSAAKNNFSCRNTTTYEGYYISSVSLTITGSGTYSLDGGTNGRSVVYFGSSAYADPNTSAPVGTATTSTQHSSGQTTLTWTNTDQSVSYFILYNLKTSGTCLSANASSPLTVVWTKKSTGGDDPVPSISADDVSIEYNGTSGSIAYTINNEIEGGSVSAAITGGNEGSWLSLGAVSSSNVALTCFANETNADRTATVTLTYTYNINETVTQEVTVTQGHFVVDYATLPFVWAGGPSADLLALDGVTASGLGSDYNSSNHDVYIVKLDNDGDYIQVKTDSQPGQVSIGVKMIGGGNTSTITVQESSDGETFTNVQEELTISGSQNDIINLKTGVNVFAATTRYVRLYFTKGSNVGVGPITISEVSTSPIINASDPEELAYNATSGEFGYSITNPTSATLNAVSNDSWITNVAVDGTNSKVTFDTSTNSNTTQRTGTITLSYEGAENIVITITQEGAPLTPTSLTLSGTYPTTFIEGDDFSHEGMTVTATFSNSSTEDVTSSATFTGYNMSQTGEQTVTVTYTHNNVSVTQTYTITVHEIPTKTIAQFIAAGGGKCYLTGTVSNIVNTTYGNFDLTDDSGTIYVYGCLTPAGQSAQFSTLNIEANDVIKVLANEYVYYNNTTHEAKNVVFVEEIVPNAQTLTVIATNGSVEITGKTLDNGSCEVTEGVSVTATATPAVHYTFTSWSATGGVTLDDATANPVTFSMPTNGVTLTANFTEDTKYTATFYVQGTSVGTFSTYEGEAITFPSVTAPTGYTLMGWTTATISTPQDNAPAVLVNSANMGTGNVTYYAVFAVGSGSGNVAGTLSGSDITEWDGIAYGDEETTHTVDNITWSVRGSRGSDNPWIQIRSNATPSYIKITTSGKLSNVSLSISNASNSSGGVNDITKHGDFSGNIYLSTTTSSSDEIVRATATDKVASLDLPENTNYKEVYIVASGAARIWEVDVTYSGTTYSNYCTTVPTTTVSIAAACTDGTKYYGTYSNTSAFVVPEDVTVAEIGIVDGALYVEDYASGAVVPASTGVMISSTTSGSHTLTLADGGTSVLGDDNCLRPTGAAGITAAAMEIADANCKFYRLTMHNGTQIGFYWGAANGGAFDIVANKAYLAVPNGSVSGANLQSFWFDNETTAVRTVDNGQLTIDNGEWYTLDGRRLNGKPTQKGLYIVNGKKVVIK